MESTITLNEHTLVAQGCKAVDVLCELSIVVLMCYLCDLRSSLKKREWGSELQRVISRDQEYVLLTCEQLVGVCLYVFIQPRLLPHVR